MYGDAVGRWRNLKLITGLLVLEVFVMFENGHFPLLYGNLRSLVKRASVEHCSYDESEVSLETPTVLRMYRERLPRASLQYIPLRPFSQLLRPTTKYERSLNNYSIAPRESHYLITACSQIAYP